MKRSSLILSLFLVSILFISGCSEFNKCDTMPNDLVPVEVFLIDGKLTLEGSFYNKFSEYNQSLRFNDGVRFMMHDQGVYPNAIRFRGTHHNDSMFYWCSGAGCIYPIEDYAIIYNNPGELYFEVLFLELGYNSTHKVFGETVFGIVEEEIESYNVIDYAIKNCIIY